jgi:hypothetical protein
MWPVPDSEGDDHNPAPFLPALGGPAIEASWPWEQDRRGDAEVWAGLGV